MLDNGVTSLHTRPGFSASNYNVQPVLKEWNPISYGVTVAEILALAGNGERLMPLAEGECCSEEARRRIRKAKPEELFGGARAPRGALAGLYLYFSCRDDAHETAQSDNSAEGSYWHAIVHRQEPDAGNSSYWFQRVGEHAVFPALLERAWAIGAAHPGADLQLSTAWDPIAFIRVCERAGRQPGSELEQAALEIQRTEWQLLFDYCAGRSLD
jgi:hypothetical protein